MLSLAAAGEEHDARFLLQVGEILIMDQEESVVELLAFLSPPTYIWQYPLGLDLVKMRSQHGTCSVPTIINAVGQNSECLVRIKLSYDLHTGKKGLEVLCCPGEKVLLQDTSHVSEDSLLPLKFLVRILVTECCYVCNMTAKTCIRTDALLNSISHYQTLNR